MISQTSVYFSKIKILSFLIFLKTNNPVNFFKNVFAIFSKNQQFGGLFQKRFVSGICDLEGVHLRINVAPYRMHFALDLLRKSYYRSFSCFSEEWLGSTIVGFGAVTVSVVCNETSHVRRAG